MKLMITRAMAVSDPNSAALGTSRRMNPQKGEQTILNNPLSTKHQIPMCQVRIAASNSDNPDSRPAKKDGPSTKRIMPNVEGVSKPSGIAVTLAFPVFFAR